MGRLPIAMHGAKEERLAERARDDEPLGFGIRRIVAAHEADLQASQSALRGLDDPVAVAERVRHRLLEQHVLPAGECRHRLIGMEARGRCDDDDTHLVVREQLVE